MILVTHTKSILPADKNSGVSICLTSIQVETTAI